MAITTAAGAHYYVTTDKLGSVRSIAKRDGTWQLSQRFDPYGRMIVRDSAMTYTLGAQLRYGWTGREWDAETGFSYHRARYFDPESRRWTQEDPIGYAGGMNVYAYVGGSPMEATDPSGLNKALDFWTAVPQIRPSGASSRFDALLAWGEANWEQFVLAGGGGAVETSTEPRAAVDVMWERQLNVRAICATISCPSEMSDSDRLAFLRDLESLFDFSNSYSREVGAWILPDERGKWMLSSTTQGERHSGTVNLIPAPQNAVARFHTHPDHSELVPGLPGLSGPDWARRGYADVVWQRDHIIYASADRSIYRRTRLYE